MGANTLTPSGQWHTVSRLVAQGADILDIGGESTRPGAEPVSAGEEIDRVAPVIERLVRETTVPISIDTTKASVARAALGAGAELINDVSGGNYDPEIQVVAAEASAVYICGHLRGDNFVTMHTAEYMAQTVEQVRADFVAKVARLPQTLRYRTIVDPGLGFGKHAPLNIQLARSAGALAEQLGCPVLIGPSRKRFVAQYAADDLETRDAATAGIALAAVNLGTHLIRVHNVSVIRAALRAFEAVMGESDGSGD